MPSEPRAFVREIEKLLGSTSQLNTAHANPADWTSAAFLFQLTNDELPALAAGQLSLLQGAGGVQAHQIESFVFIALDLKPGNWSRTTLARLTRELNRLFPLPAVLLFRHPLADGTPLLSIAVNGADSHGERAYSQTIHHRARKISERGVSPVPLRDTFAD